MITQLHRVLSIKHIASIFLILINLHYTSLTFCNSLDLWCYTLPAMVASGLRLREEQFCVKFKAIGKERLTVTLSWTQEGRSRWPKYIASFRFLYASSTSRPGRGGTAPRPVVWLTDTTQWNNPSLSIDLWSIHRAVARDVTNIAQSLPCGKRGLPAYSLA